MALIALKMVVADTTMKKKLIKKNQRFLQIIGTRGYEIQIIVLLSMNPTYRNPFKILL